MTLDEEIAALKLLRDGIDAVNVQLDAADKALLAAGIASVGSLANRIERLAAERDAAVYQCHHTSRIET